MKNHRVINVAVLPATDKEPCRIKILESRFKKTDKIIIYFNEFDNAVEEVKKYLSSININIVGFGNFKDSYFFFSDTWSDTQGFKNIKGEFEQN